jgi:hypothetical protein
MTRRNIIKNIIGVIIITCFVLLFRSCTPPSQKSIERRFVKNRESFDKIKSMLKEDQSLEGVAPYGIMESNEPMWHSPAESGFPQQRYEEYLVLLKKIGAYSVIHDRDQIRFLVASWGMASHGWRVAIVSRETEPNNMIAKLSDFRSATSSSDPNTAYCHIDKDWYIWIMW